MRLRLCDNVVDAFRVLKLFYRFSSDLCDRDNMLTVLPYRGPLHPESTFNLGIVFNIIHVCLFAWDEESLSLVHDLFCCFGSFKFFFYLSPKGIFPVMARMPTYNISRKS